MIDTKIAGEPPQIEDLAQALSSSMPGPIDQVRADLNTIRNVPAETWDGQAADAASEAADHLRTTSDKLMDAFTDTAKALENFATDLRQIQNQMDDHLRTATTAGLRVEGRLIYEPNPIMTAVYPDGEMPPEVAADIRANEARFTTYNTLVEDVDRTIGSYADACKRLTDDLADVTDQDWLVEIAIAALPGTLSYLGEDVIPAFKSKLGNTHYASQALDGLTGTQIGDLTHKLVGSIDNIDDAQLTSKLATTGGKALDRYLLGYGIATDLQHGESTGQALVSQGGGAGVGVLTDWGIVAGANFVRSAATGAPLGPWGMVAAGAVGTIAGVGVSLIWNDRVDDWYDDQEFEELIRRGLEEQGTIR